MSRRLVLNVGLAGIYLVWVDERSWLGVLVGIAIGFAIISVYDLSTGLPIYAVRLFRLVRFGAYFLAVLVRANLQIAWEIMTPGFRQTPRILRYPVAHLTAVQKTVFANCITLTPGTLVVDDLEALAVQGGDQGLVHLQQRLAAGADDERVFGAFGPARRGRPCRRNRCRRTGIGRRRGRSRGPTTDCTRQSGRTPPPGRR